MLSATPSSPDPIVDVWLENLDRTFVKIETIFSSMDGKTEFVIGLDAEFCVRDGPMTPWGDPSCPETWYGNTRQTVDDGSLVQVGLAIEYKDRSMPAMIYQFNLEFDPTTRAPGSSGVRFLRKRAGLNLERHCAQGIPIEQFIQMIERSGALSSNSITWVTYQGFADIGYLLLGLGRKSKLPEQRSVFLSWVRSVFPNLYDLKVLHKIGYCTTASETGHANLGAFAEDIGAKRIGGSHTAGSDALLNLECYHRAVLREHPFSPMIRFRGHLYGVCGSLPQDPAGVDMLVRKINLNQFNLHGCTPQLYSLFPMFGTVSVEITFGSSLRTYSYALALEDLARITSADLEIGVFDPRGWQAHATVWRLEVGGSSTGRTSLTLVGNVLRQSGAVCQPSLTWLSSSSATFVFLVRALTRTG
ncbi:hypothetical protein ZWY2020_030227 [Hordeum vulgare]|nr:hypothetical protein ZWY2020_030227 [Hordeum vulgare]